MHETSYMRRDKAAEYLRQRYGFGATGTLAKLACIGGGPCFQKIGRLPLYTATDLDKWAVDRMSANVANTSELTVCSVGEV